MWENSSYQLRQLDGIGPKSASLLSQIGIQTFEDLELKANPANLERVIELLI